MVFWFCVLLLKKRKLADAKWRSVVDMHMQVPKASAHFPLAAS